MKIYELYRTGKRFPLREAQALAQAMRNGGGPVLGVDVGTRHVGIALSDSNGIVSFPHTGFQRSSVREDIRKVREIAEKAGTRTAIVGMPVAPFGKECDKLRVFTKAYAEVILRECGMQHVGFWDESNTTVLAKDDFMRNAKKRERNNMKLRKESVDAGAAALILQEALDAMENIRESPS